MTTFSSFGKKKMQILFQKPENQNLYVNFDNTSGKIHTLLFVLNTNLFFLYFDRYYELPFDFDF